MRTVRKAMPADAAAIEGIYDKIHTEEESGRSTTSWKRGIYPTRDTIDIGLAKKDLYVMEENGTVVAAMRINREQPDAYACGCWSCDAPPEKIMVLHTLTVDPGVSRRGIGKAMVKAYEDIAAENGCPYLRIDTVMTNCVAMGLYEKLGYSEAGIAECVFNGISGIRLMLLEKRLGCE